jgi:phosphonate transport system substrate-binding protein
VWKDASSARDAREGFTGLIAAIKEQNIALNAPAFDPAKPVFRIGALSSTEALKSLDAMRRYFLRQGERQFEYYLYGTSKQLSDALFKGKVDIAWNNSLPVAQNLLRDKRLLAPIAIDSELNYTFQVVVRKDSGLQSLQDLAGKKLVLGNEETAELSILPRYYLPRAGLEMGKLTLVSLNGNIDPVTRKPTDGDAFVAKAVQDGAGQAGVVGAEYAKTLAADPASPLKVIWTSPAFSRETMVTLPRYKHIARFSRIMQTMNLNDAIAKTLLAGENGTRWVPKSNVDGYRDLLDALQQERTPARLERVSMR